MMRSSYPYNTDNRISEQGFTLVELLMALGIFSFLSTAGVLLLRSSVDTQAVVAERLSDGAVINRLSNVLTSDLSQLANRTTRNEIGDRQFTFNVSDNGQSFSFVRFGLSNGSDGIRPALQKVEYRFADGILERVNWPLLDGAASNDPISLLSNIRDFQIRYKALDGSWRNDWTPADISDYPRALEITIEQENIAPLVMQYMVGPQSRILPQIPNIADKDR